jgi:hypothetical protein
MGLFEVPLAPVVVVQERLKMIRSHASPIAAEMIDSVSFGNRANEQLVRDSMSCYVPPIYPDLAVAAASHGSRPLPAFIVDIEGFLDFFCEPLSKRFHRK